MTRRTYWGIAALIVILIAASGFIYYQWAQVAQLKEQLTQDEERFEEKDKPVAENELPPAPAGYKWVQHGDHHDLVPIDAPDTRQDSHISPETANVTPVSLDTSEGPPIYEEVAASDEVPKFAELKQMTIEELGTLMEKSIRKRRLSAAEHSNRLKALRDAESKLTRDAKTNAEYHQILMANQEKLKPLEAAEQAALREMYVHQITGSRANRVRTWLTGIERQKTRQFSISWTLPEPFDE